MFQLQIRSFIFLYRRGGTVFVFFEDAAEVIAVIEADGQGNLADIQMPFPQELHGSIDAQVVDIFDRRLAGDAFKEAAEMMAAYIRHAGKLGQGQFFRVMLINIF